MITPRLTELQRIDTALLLECVAPRSRQHLADLLVSPEVHFLVIYTCDDESRFEYLEVGPGRRAHRVEDVLGVHPDALRARYLVVSSTCPEGVIPAGLAPAHSAPYGLARLVPMRPVVIKTSLRLPETSAAEPKPTPVNTTETASQKKAVAATEVSAPTSMQTHGAVTFSALPDETPADTLRRALHGVLSSITDREAALSVREGSVGERLGVFASREHELAARAAELTAREHELAARAAELTTRENALSAELAERESALSSSEEDLKVRRNSVAFREKNLTAREQDTASRLLDINAREGAIRNAEREFSEREVSLAAREKDARSLLAALAAEKAAFDEMVAAHKVREAAVAAREKHIAGQEATFKAETAALLCALESITTASRASTAASGNGR